MKLSVSSFNSFQEILRFRAEDTPNSTAFIFLDYTEDIDQTVEISYAQLDGKARSIAAQLQSSRLSGKRVLLLYPHGLDFIAAFFGCIYSGVIAVPVYPPSANRPLDYLEGITKHCQPDALLLCRKVPKTVCQKLQNHYNLGNLQWIYTDESGDKYSHLWRELYPDINNQTHIQFTSGSTGLQKGVVLTHKNLIYNSEYIRQGFGNNSNSIGISWLPFYHDMGLIGNILQPIYVGSKVIFMSPQHFIQKPLRWLQAISDFQGTTSGGPNFAYEQCLRKIKPEERYQLSLQSWSLAYSGAEIVRAETLKKFQEYFEPCGFYPEFFFPCYGMAEATLMITGGTRQVRPKVLKVSSEALAEGVATVSKGAEEYRTFVSCGWTFPEQRVLIVDPDTHKIYTSGKVGEVWVCGPSIALGYFKEPKLTQKTFQALLSDPDPDSFLRTGDLGFLYEGELYIVDRLKDLIIIRGRNHYPQDIEWSVRSCYPCFQHYTCAAFSLEIENEEKLIICQEVERNFLSHENYYEIPNIIRECVANYHDVVPHNILLVSYGSIPKTTSGKVQRNLCRSYYTNNLLIPLEIEKEYASI
jgi:acyl-CoA synthetase (AMP-forming)/AMP-acid ligase II